MCVHVFYKMVHYSIFVWWIFGFVRYYHPWSSTTTTTPPAQQITTLTSTHTHTHAHTHNHASKYKKNKIAMNDLGSKKWLTKKTSQVLKLVMRPYFHTDDVDLWISMMIIKVHIVVLMSIIVLNCSHLINSMHKWNNISWSFIKEVYSPR